MLAIAVQGILAGYVGGGDGYIAGLEMVVSIIKFYAARVEVIVQGMVISLVEPGKRVFAMFKNAGKLDLRQVLG